jgi:hypothetical protein
MKNKKKIRVHTAGLSLLPRTFALMGDRKTQTFTMPTLNFELLITPKKYPLRVGIFDHLFDEKKSALRIGFLKDLDSLIAITRKLLCLRK